MRKVILPGTFDPPTNGHMNVIYRAAKIFEKIEIVIAVNQQKQCIFSPDERYKMMSTLAKDYKNVNVHLWEGLIVDFAKKIGARIILRGVRALSDFSHEFELSLMNKALNSDIETLLLPTDRKYFVLRSSAIKEVAMFNGDISSMVPSIVAKALKQKMKNMK